VGTRYCIPRMRDPTPRQRALPSALPLKQLMPDLVKNEDYNDIYTIGETARVITRGDIWWSIRSAVPFGNYEDNG